ncbi:hypothetical protein L6164_025962 [Bauhinia variegata]|uniref:Uncharacterized protein n=1 Tax=Bauhinia variegata TaxID=167791 RepID=A0ACB9M489_BAUVA|nr:hypothetical protein L6164_025962 [Bauhinia variegata]
MENILTCARKGGQEKKDPNSWHSLCKNRESSGEDSSIFSESQPKKLVKREKSHRAVIVNIIQSQVSKVFLKDFFFRRIHGVDSRIPKHVVSADEKSLRRYLELIHISASKAAQGNIPVNFRSTNMGISSESLNAGKLINGDGCGSARFVFEYPVASGTGSVVISANTAAQWNIGTVMASKSMINILNSSLLKQFGVSDGKNNLSTMDTTDGQGLICCGFIDSPSSFSSSSSSSYKLEKETPMTQSPNHSSTSAHKSFTSISSTTTSYDLQSSASPTLSQGMLQCTWKEGIPHFVFSADDQKEVYVAKLMKVDTTDNKALDYVYLFHLQKGSQKGHDIPDNNSQLVGKMNVSTSFTLCPSNNRIMETEFVLFGNNEYFDKGTSSHTHKKSKGFSRKLSQVFRTSPSSKHRTLSNFGGSGAIMESCPWEPYTRGRADLLEANVPSNYELAAIVAKDHLPCKKRDKVGGWGLKFLNKSGVKQTSSQSESCDRNTGDCSTSMSILIPAGLHGGPKTRNGGPSSLIDRWRSGSCDCGGWDMGCPLTVLQRRSSKGEVLSQVDMQGDCQSFDFVIQGSKDFSPTLRMVNVHDGVYFIHYQHPLSALQCFSIAVAIIHRQNPALRPDSSRQP